VWAQGRELVEYLNFYINYKINKREKRPMAFKRYNYKSLKNCQLGLEIANEISEIINIFPKYEKYNL